MDEIQEKIEYMLEKNPHKIAELIKSVYRRDPEIVERMLDYPEDADHISNRRKYDELIENIRWADGNGRGAKWSFEDIKKNSNVNFSNVDYTEYDFAYLVNMLYAKCCKYISDPSVYLKIARCLLEDKDEETKLYQGVYASRQRYNQRGEQDYYGGYNEEDRRHRRYRSEYTNDYDNRRYDRTRNHNDPFEDRRRYRNMTENNGDFFRQT
ncbi:MAG: hypothetical protein NC191_04730 [Muribaculaceae bacterium]|nr:hypothetical protein [Muribaculaceae bacterium]